MEKTKTAGWMLAIIHFLQVFIFGLATFIIISLMLNSFFSNPEMSVFLNTVILHAIFIISISVGVYFSSLRIIKKYLISDNKIVYISTVLFTLASSAKISLTVGPLVLVSLSPFSSLINFLFLVIQISIFYLLSKRLIKVSDSSLVGAVVTNNTAPIWDFINVWTILTIISLLPALLMAMFSLFLILAPEATNELKNTVFYGLWGYILFIVPFSTFFTHISKKYNKLIPAFIFSIIPIIYAVWIWSLFVMYW